jgi:large subunit ribosomal protein L37Ae
MVKTKLVKSSGRYGIRYGVSVRRRIATIESKQKQKQLCIFCKGRAKRISKGIWLCKRCGKKFAGHAYYLEQSPQTTLEQKMESLKLKEEKAKKVLNKQEAANKQSKVENKKSKK